MATITNTSPPGIGKGVYRNNAPTGVAYPTNVQDQLKQRTWQNARKVIKDEFIADPKPGGMRHAFLANVAMMLYDHYGLDHKTANEAADNVIKLCFEDTYY